MLLLTLLHLRRRAIATASRALTGKVEVAGVEPA